MKNIWAIFKRELAAYFNSPVAYIVIVVYLLLSGFFFFSALFDPRGAQEASLRAFFGTGPFFYMIFAPAITMRLLAEEKRNGTIELLSTMPIKDHQIIMGKYLAAMGLIIIALCLTITYPITVAIVGNPDWGMIAGGYLGMLLLSGAFAAIGIMVSSWTKNQIAAFIVAFLICFFTIILNKILPYFSHSIAGVLEFLSFDYHFSALGRGVIDTRNVVYFLSVIGFCLFVATQSLMSRKWATA